MTPPVIPPHKLTMILMTSVVGEISDCEINPAVDAEARNQPRRNPPTTFKVFIELVLRSGLVSPLHWGACFTPTVEAEEFALCSSLDV